MSSSHQTTCSRGTSLEYEGPNAPQGRIRWKILGQQFSLETLARRLKDLSLFMYKLWKKGQEVFMIETFKTRSWDGEQAMAMASPTYSFYPLNDPPHVLHTSRPSMRLFESRWGVKLFSYIHNLEKSSKLANNLSSPRGEWKRFSDVFT